MNLLRSFGYAFQGIRFGLKERNFRLHCLAALLVMILGILLSISLVEWMIVSICIGAVMSAELINSAVEDLCDELVASQKESYAKMGKPKDLAAGSVLVISFFTLVVGILIFVPHFFTLLQTN